MTPPNLDALPDWIVRFATAENAPERLVDTVCTALVRAGLPLWRMSVSAPTIDPTIRGLSVNWMRGQEVAVVEAAHGPDSAAFFQRSPIYALMTDGRLAARWRIEADDGCEQFPLLAELRDDGGTEYALSLVGFAPGMALAGVAFSFCTDRPGGFEEAHLAMTERVLPALGLAFYRLSVSRTASEALNTYLGPLTGGNVLAGQIHRGEGRTITAALLLADLSGFTALTDREDATRVVGWLNEHLGALGDAVIGNGGEILKFLGDGFLAVFPIDDPAALPCQVCDRALQAAEQALAANRIVNAARRAQGAPELEADIVLHAGDVIYGNVGTARRLDFTTIGRAVNEASRIEKLCDELGHHLLLSDTFARRTGRTCTPLGAFRLRGLETLHPLWTVLPA